MNWLIIKVRKNSNAILIFLIVLFALIYRRPGALTHPQLWAEDGPLYFQQAEDLGFRTFFTPDGGYLHFVPRIIAFVWHLLRVNYFYIPTCYSISELLFVFFIALNIWKTSAFLNIRHRVLYSTIFLLIPLGSDIFMNLANINWVASLYLINYLFIRYTDYTHKNWYLNLAMLAITSLSGPFSTLLLPIVLVTVIVERKELSFKKLIPLLVIFFGGIIQLIYIKIIDPGMYRGQPGPPERYHLFRLVTDNMAELLFFKYGFMQWVPGWLKAGISLAVFVLLILLFIKAYSRISYKRRYLLPGYAAIIFLVYVKTYWPNESKISLDNPRYYFIPFVCAAWIIILAFDKKIKYFFVAIYLLYLFRLPYLALGLPDKHWKQQIQEYYQGKGNVISINPEGWLIGLPELKNKQ